MSGTPRYAPDPPPPPQDDLSLVVAEAARRERARRKWPRVIVQDAKVAQSGRKVVKPAEHTRWRTPKRYELPEERFEP